MLRHLKDDTNIFIILLFPLVLVIFGAAGYHAIEGWPFLDCLYMTVITVATVGFTEIHPMSSAGRIFTIILIIGGVVILAYCIQFFVMYMLQKNLFGTLWRRRMDKKIMQIKDHVILCGYGKIGRHVAEHFLSENAPFILVAHPLPETESLKEKGILFIEGDATDENVLREAGIERAKTLVTVVGSDADNMFITMTARGLAPGIRIIARAEDAGNMKKMIRAGADKVALPYEMGGRRIASQVLYPNVAEFLDVAMNAENMELRISEIPISNDSSLKGSSLISSSIRKDTGVVILAIKSVDGRLHINPAAETKLESGNLLICLGTREQLQSLQKLAGG